MNIIFGDDDADSDDLNIDHNGDDDADSDHINFEDITFKQKNPSIERTRNMVFLEIVTCCHESGREWTLGRVQTWYNLKFHFYIKMIHFPICF